MTGVKYSPQYTTTSHYNHTYNYLNLQSVFCAHQIFNFAFLVCSHVSNIIFIDFFPFLCWFVCTSQFNFIKSKSSLSCMKDNEEYILSVASVPLSSVFKLQLIKISSAEKCGTTTSLLYCKESGQKVPTRSCQQASGALTVHEEKETASITLNQ